MKIFKILLFIIILFPSQIKAETLYLSLEKPVKDNFIIINLKKEETNIPEKSLNYNYHRVKKGEYLNKIAKEHDRKTKKLVKINELKNPNLIYPKQKIYLNNKRPLNLKDIPQYHIVKYGENIIEIANFYELDYKKIIKINQLKGYIIYPNQKLKLKE